MNNRCGKDKNYLDIDVCNSWKNSFEEFLRDMGECPDGLTIDRKNSYDNYYKENCRWATPQEQSENLKNIKLIEHKGLCFPIKKWCKKLNIPYSRTRARLEFGWSIDDAFYLPKNSRPKSRDHAKRIRRK